MYLLKVILISFLWKFMEYAGGSQESTFGGTTSLIPPSGAIGLAQRQRRRGNSNAARKNHFDRNTLIYD
jgi:hypothetical protein